MIQTTSQELTCVIYQDGQVARSFRISKNKIRPLLYFVPVLVLVPLLILGSVFIYFQDLKKMASLKIPQMVRELQNQKNTLEKQNSELSNTQDELLKRVRVGVQNKTSLHPLFRPVIGAKNLIERNMVKVENFKFTINEKSISIKLNLVNQLQGDKLAGHTFIILQQGPGLQLFPKVNLANGIEYIQGERFAVSRFRPLKASFPKLEGSISARVIVFSRLGDLLLNQVIPIGEKNE